MKKEATITKKTHFGTYQVTPKSELRVGQRIAVHNSITGNISFYANIISVYGEGENIQGVILQDGMEKPHINGLGTSLVLIKELKSTK